MMYGLDGESDDDMRCQGLTSYLVPVLCQLEYSRLAFFATEAALLVGTILPIVAVTTPDWMRIHYQTRSFLGLMINVTVRLGLYQEETISGNVLQKDYAGWCGDGTATDPSQWCDKVRSGHLFCEA